MLYRYWDNHSTESLFCTLVLNSKTNQGIECLSVVGALKVLTNEKRGGLSGVSFDKSPFKLFSLKFSNRLVQAPSCERHKTAPRTLFVPFANNNYFQIAV
jgi:hypothetical protein